MSDYEEEVPEEVEAPDLVVSNESYSEEDNGTVVEFNIED